MARITPTAVIVTRGDVDLEPALSGIPKAWPVVVWNNAEREQDLKVYGHFAALPEIQTAYAYFQDDDAICPAQEVLDAWTPEYADRILLNEADGETPWISWGAICHRDLPGKAISRYVGAYGWSDDVLLWCDMIVSTLTPWVNVDLKAKVTHLPHAAAPNRMWMRPDHYTEQARVRDLALALDSGRTE